MGRPRKHPLPGASQVVTPKAPVLKYTQASRIADKNARTMVKISQLLKVVSEPGYAEGDPHRLVEKYIEKLKKRVNKRLYILAKWSDSSPEERQAEFRHRMSTGRNFSVQTRTSYPLPTQITIPTIGGSMFRPPAAPESGLLLNRSMTIGMQPTNIQIPTIASVSGFASTAAVTPATIPFTPLAPKPVEPAIVQPVIPQGTVNQASTAEQSQQ